MQHFNELCRKILVELAVEASFAKTNEEKFFISARLDIVEAFIEAASKDLDESLGLSYPASRATDNARGISPRND